MQAFLGAVSGYKDHIVGDLQRANTVNTRTQQHNNDPGNQFPTKIAGKAHLNRIEQRCNQTGTPNTVPGLCPQRS